MIEEKLINILKFVQVHEIIPFLKSLNEGERKKLAPTIKEGIKFYTEYKSGNFGSIRGTMDHCVILSIAAFVCLDYNSYKRNMMQISYLSNGFIKFHEYSQEKLMEQIKIDDILEWHRPDWMSDFINNPRTNNELKDFSYDDIIRWHHKGYIELTPELIAITLRAHPYEYVRSENIHMFKPENLYKYPETLSEHIWLLFLYPTDINYDNYWNLDDKEGSWKKIFKILVENNKIDHLRLLKEILSAANRNFNKVQIGWFMDLFNELAPTSSELLEVQDELFQCFTSPQSKAITNAINHIKTICIEKDFRVNDFITYIPVLLGSPTKAVITGCIDIADRLLKAKTPQANEVLVMLSTGFINVDEGIQKKLAKLIVKYGKPQEMATHISAYSNQILASVKEILKDYLEEPIGGESTHIQIIPHQEVLPLPALIGSDNEIPSITSFEDFLFFAAQAFDNNEPWHCYMLPVYLQQFRDQITVDTIGQLEPIFKKAYTTIDKWSNQIGLLDRTFAAFFMSYGKYLGKKYPQASDYLDTLVKDNVLDMVNFRDRIDNLELVPTYFILLKVLNCIKNGETIELLSTPTHTPLWIDPVVLVERLKVYQDQGKTPYGFDIQLAILRCALDDTQSALKLAQEVLSGELRELMVYLLNPETETPRKVEHPAWWMCASISRKPHNIPSMVKEWGFERIQPEYLTGDYRWSVEGNGHGITILKLKLPTYNVKSHTETTFLPEYYYSMFRSRFLWAGDVMRLMASMPYNYDSIIVQYVNHIRDYNSMDSTEKASLINGLRTLIDVRLPLSEMGYLALALSLFAPDKTIKDFGASLWSELVLYGIMDNSKLGTKIAELLHTKWLPLKRFIDVLEVSMLNISDIHNKSLEELITVFLNKIGQKKLTNLKKLQEIHNELKVQNNN